jgi:replication-associated recombination protein RarA
VLGRARERLGAHGERTILFLDEITASTRRSRTLLPAVEDSSR